MGDPEGERKALFLILTTFVYARPERREETYGAVSAVIRRCHEMGILDQDVPASTELMQLYADSLPTPAGSVP
jgi:hypothetical protein